VGRDRSFFFPCAPGEVVSVDGFAVAMTPPSQAAWFGAVSTGSPDPYRDLVAFAQTNPPVEAGLRQVARVTLPNSTAP
jgi:hypothetical protein